MDRLLAFVLALVAAVASSCASHLKVDQLPTFAACDSVAPAGEPRFVALEGLDPRRLPLMIPYVVVHDVAESAGSFAERLALAPPSKNADLIVIEEKGHTAAHDTAALLFLGPILSYDSREEFRACAFRLSPVDLGFVVDGAGMITSVTETARASGMREGDRFTGVNGKEVTIGERAIYSDHLLELANLKPGQETTVSWIRPGTGKMEGKLVCQANQPTHLALPDMLKKYLEDESDREKMKGV